MYCRSNVFTLFKYEYFLSESRESNHGNIIVSTNQGASNICMAVSDVILKLQEHRHYPADL